MGTVNTKNCSPLHIPSLKTAPREVAERQEQAHENTYYPAIATLGQEFNQPDTSGSTLR